MYKVIEDKKDEPSLKEAQDFVGGYVEGINFPNGDYMIVNEEGKLLGLQPNPGATMIWTKFFGPSDVIMGPAILMKSAARKEWL